MAVPSSYFQIELKEFLLNVDEFVLLQQAQVISSQETLKNELYLNVGKGKGTIFMIEASLLLLLKGSD